MQPEHSENSESTVASIPGRIVRRGFILYLLGAVVVPFVCYIFGWRSLENYGTGFIYGGLVMAAFGLFMAACNSLPLQLAGSKPAAAESGLKREDTSEKAGPASRGFKLFLVTLFAGVLLAITGFIMRLPG